MHDPNGIKQGSTVRNKNTGEVHSIVAVDYHENLIYWYNSNGNLIRSDADHFAIESKGDIVNEPTHYKSKSGLQAIDVIEAFELNYNIGTVTKYILRAGKKDPAKHIEDLKKAQWFLNREIQNLEGDKK